MCRRYRRKYQINFRTLSDTRFANICESYESLKLVADAVEAFKAEKEGDLLAMPMQEGYKMPDEASYRFASFGGN